jgi:hypothetical protein
VVARLAGPLTLAPRQFPADFSLASEERSLNKVHIGTATRDPAIRFVALLQAALAGGQAHVADRQGKAPAEAAAWGWQPSQSGRRWAAQGTCIGWVVENDLYLDPLTSYQTVQSLAGVERMPLSEQALRQQLRKCGLLVSMDAGRGMLQVRRTLAGRPRQVLHLRASDLRGS